MANTWSDIYWKWVRKGCDRSDAAYRADQWEARQKRRTEKLAEQTLNDLRYALDGATIESSHPLIVSILTSNRAARMNLQNILERLKEEWNG